jgi:hypothetical protein
MAPRVRTAFAVVLLLAGSAAASPMRGVIEGYYGKPWTGAARRDVIAFLGTHHMDTFVYSPKNDEYHRARWRDPYPADQLDDLRATALVARKAKVRFVYGLTPALDVCYSCVSDRHALRRKLSQLLSAHVRRFALLFDDSPATLTNPDDVAHFGGSDDAALARAQADLVNRAARWLRSRGATLDLMVPTDYAGVDCHPYHAALGSALRGKVPVGWTGPGVFADHITGAMARARAACVPGHPVVLWDNVPVNDTILAINLHLGPLVGRDADLAATLGGHLLNPMTEAHASLVTLGTAGTYFADPQGYDAEAAWRATLTELGNGGGLAVLAEQTRSSALDLDDARALATVVDGVTAAYPSADWEASVGALAAEEAREAAAPGDIAAQIGGTPLADEIAPWVVELGAHVARGMEAVTLLRALKPTFAEVTASVAGGTLHASGRVVPPDAAIAGVSGPGFATAATAIAARIAAPPVGALVACLGDLRGADINLCTTYGLNVHGKALYVVIHTVSSIEVVADRNVHDRLVRFAGTTYAAWAAHQPVGTLSLTADDAPVTLDGDGGFTLDVPLPGSGHVRLVAATSAGDATARAVP